MDIEQHKNSGVLSLISRVTEVAQGLQVTEKAQRQFQKVETRLLKELQTRLDRVAGPAVREVKAARATISASAARAKASFVAVPVGGEPPDQLLLDLLERSKNQTREEARLELFSAVLKNMLPDEARILSVLSSGKVHALVHVGIGPPIGAVTRYVLENASNIGKAAGLTLPQMTPIYLQRLQTMGVVEFGPEDERAADMYKLTEADEMVLEASKRAGYGSRFKARIVRRSLRISELGKQLWQAAQPQAG